MSKFDKPDFRNNELELRFESGEICIYGTKESLKKLGSLIQDLLQNPKQGHLHLEDFRILTENSLPGVVAIFEK